MTPLEETSLERAKIPGKGKFSPLAAPSCGVHARKGRERQLRPRTLHGSPVRERRQCKETALAYVEAEPRAQQPEAHCDVQKSWKRTVELGASTFTIGLSNFSPKF